jgi:hypothetical protein
VPYPEISEAHNTQKTNKKKRKTISSVAIMTPKCIVNCCDSVSQKGDPKHAFFYGMPVYAEGMKLWVSIIERYSGLRPLRRNSQLKNAVVCGKHFGDDSFRSHSVYHNPELVANAVPSIFLGVSDAPKESGTPPLGEKLLEPPTKKIRLSYSNARTTSR